MDQNKIAAAARRYIKHKARLAIVPYGELQGLQETMAPYGDEVQKSWFDALQGVDRTDPLLSRLLHEAYQEALQDIRANIGEGEMLHRGLADFHATFNVTEMLPKGEA